MDRQTLIRGARVYDRAGDVHRPPVKDVIVEGNRIASVTLPGELSDQKTQIVEVGEPTPSRRAVDRRRRNAAHPRPHQRPLSFLRRSFERPLRGHAIRRVGAALATRLLGQAQQGRTAGAHAARRDGGTAPRHHHHPGHEFAGPAGRGNARHHSRCLCRGWDPCGVLDCGSRHRGARHRAVPAVRHTCRRCRDHHRQARRRACRPRVHRSTDQAAQSAAATAALGAQPFGAATLLDGAARRHCSAVRPLSPAGVHSCL